ncbi:MAG: glycoside hydrolase family 127 protein [Bacteroidales bacterium]
MAGLRDAYHLCGNTEALNVEARLADWIETIVKDLNPDQIQLMLNCEHGGINEVLADLYADTGIRNILIMVYSTIRRYWILLLQVLMFYPVNMEIPISQNWLVWPGGMS